MCSIGGIRLIAFVFPGAFVLASSLLQTFSKWNSTDLQSTFGWAGLRELNVKTHEALSSYLSVRFYQFCFITNSIKFAGLCDSAVSISVQRHCACTTDIQASCKRRAAECAGNGEKTATTFQSNKCTYS